MLLLSCTLVLLATVSASPTAAVTSGGGGGAGGARLAVGGAGGARLTSTAFQASADDRPLAYGGTSQSLFSSPTSSSGDDSRGFWNEGEDDDEAGGKEEEDGASALAVAVGRGTGSGLRGAGAGTVPVVSGRALKSPPSVASAKSEKVATLPSFDSGTTGATKPTARSSSNKVATLPSSDSGTTGTTKPTAISADDARSSSNKVATLPSSNSVTSETNITLDSGTTGTTKPTARSSSNKVATLPSSETSITTSRSNRSLGAGEDYGSGKGGKKRPGGQTGLSQDAGACDCVEMWASGCVEELPGTSDIVEKDARPKRHPREAVANHARLVKPLGPAPNRARAAVESCSMPRQRSASRPRRRKAEHMNVSTSVDVLVPRTIRSSVCLFEARYHSHGHRPAMHT